MSKLGNDYGTRNNHNQRKRGGHNADCSRIDDDAGNVRCLLRVLLRHPQGYTGYLQEQGTVGKRHHALHQTKQRDKL